MRTFLLRPSRGSVAGAALAREMGVRMIRRTGSRYRYRPGDIIINWGNSVGVDGAPLSAYINNPLAVQLAIGKQYTWARLQDCGVPTVEWSHDRADAFDESRSKIFFYP